jgi:hypothetical protein
MNIDCIQAYGNLYKYILFFCSMNNILDLSFSPPYLFTSAFAHAQPEFQGKNNYTDLKDQVS